MTTHVEDGALVRHLDREDTADERAVVTAHLAACDRCATRMRTLGRAADVLSAALRAADLPVARRRPRPRWDLRVAAALLVLAGVGGAVRPVRAWVVERADMLWRAVTGREDTSAARGAPGRSPSASVAFVPAGDAFTIEVTDRQRAGVLRIETVRGDTAVALVLDGSGMDDLVVLPGTLRIMSRPTSSASYVIRLPARLTSVRVLVRDVPAWEYRPGEAPREIDLATGAMSEADGAARSRGGGSF